MINFASFKYLLICIYDLLSSYINIIIDNISKKYSHLKLLGIKSINTIKFVIVEKFKSKIN